MSNKANKDLIIKEVEEVTDFNSEKEKIVVIDENGKIKKIDLSKLVTGSNESCMLVFDHTIPH